MRDVVGSLSSLATVATDAAVELDAAADEAVGGEARLALLDTASIRLDELVDVLDGFEPERRRLVWPLNVVRSTFDEEVDERLEELRTARQRVLAIRELLAGPSSYLVLGANNAEMSGSVGMPLTAGVLRIEGGNLEMSEFTPTSELLAPRGPTLPQNLYDLYANQGIGYDFRGTTATPDFPLAAPIMAAMSATVATGPVDGVLLIDTLAVGALVDLTGPVEVDGVTYDSGDVVYALLIGNYERFSTTEERDERVQAQGRFAQAVFDRITAGRVGLVGLSNRLSELARGRHVLAWSRDEVMQSLWEDIGADGGLGPRTVAVSVENMDGNKLDSFIRPRVVIDTEVLPNGGHQFDLVVEIPNPELPEETSPYILGNAPEVHFTQLVIHLPEGAEVLQVLEAPSRLLEVEGVEDESVVQTAMFAVEVGQTARYALRGKLPVGVDSIELLPSARVAGTEYVVNGDVHPDGARTVVPLAEGDDDGSPRGAPAAAAASAIVAVGAGGLLVLRRERRLRAA